MLITDCNISFRIFNFLTTFICFTHYLIFSVFIFYIVIYFWLKSKPHCNSCSFPICQNLIIFRWFWIICLRNLFFWIFTFWLVLFLGLLWLRLIKCGCFWSFWSWLTWFLFTSLFIWNTTLIIRIIYLLCLR